MEIKKTNHQILLKGITCDKIEKVYTFEVYTIEGFNFKKDNLTCQHIKEGQAGLYMFSYRYVVRIFKTNENREHNFFHALLYLGMADNLQKRPFNLKHEKFNDLIKTSCNSISIYQCSKTEKPKEIESNILRYYNFKFNEQENENAKGLPISEAEG